VTVDRISEYLDELAKALRARGAYSRRLVTEVRDHLVDSVEAGVRHGLTPDAAQNEAMAHIGPPELVAKTAASVPRPGRVLLLAVCGSTMASVAFLSLSLLVLRPPRANYVWWSVEASFASVLTALTFLSARAGELSSAWARSALFIGTVALGALGTSTFFANLAGHFEGYSLVLGVLFTLQALLTLTHLRPGFRSFVTPA
jgi:hypothetical protein